MSKNQKIDALQTISQIMLDAKLVELRQAAQARAQTIAHLHDLRVPNLHLNDTLGVAEAMATLAYQRWADKRRLELNQILAQQTALWLDKQDGARHAFGQADVLRAIAQRHRKTLAPRHDRQS